MRQEGRSSGAGGIGEQCSRGRYVYSRYTVTHTVGIQSHTHTPASACMAGQNAPRLLIQGLSSLPLSMCTSSRKAGGGVPGLPGTWRYKQGQGVVYEGVSTIVSNDICLRYQVSIPFPSLTAASAPGAVSVAAQAAQHPHPPTHPQPQLHTYTPTCMCLIARHGTGCRQMCALRPSLNLRMMWRTAFPCRHVRIWPHHGKVLSAAVGWHVAWAISVLC